MIRKNKKGVSPVIATVLLIGMVIVLALIIFTWMRSLTQEAITKFDGENVELICGRVNFDAEYSGGKLSIVNRENIPIYQMKVKKIGAGEFDTVYLNDMITSGNWPTFGLDATGSFVGDIDTDGATELVIIPVLLGNADDDKKKFTCEESAGRKVFV